MKRILLGLWLAVALCTSAMATNFTTAPITVTSSAWVDLGAGPLAVTRLTPDTVFLMIADSAPAASDIGEPMDSDGINGMAPISRVMNTSQHVWARAIGKTASLAVSPLDAMGSTGPTSSATAGIVTTETAALASSLVVKASAGNLYEWRITTTTVAGYLLIFNATAAPADGAVTPKDCVAIPAAASVGMNLTIPENFSTGITLVFSTTGCYVKTASATAYLKGGAK